MNQDQLEGNWKQLKGKLQEKWGNLTNDDLDVLEGRRENLSGRLQERYGLAKEEAEKQASAFWSSVERTAAARK